MCFSQPDFEVMFTARVAVPDPQLRQYLDGHPPQEHYPTFEELMRTFYRQDSIYQHFEMPAGIHDINWTGQVSNKTTAHIAHLHPGPIKLMVEVGSLFGHSSLQFAELVKQSGGVLICVDTWLGDINMQLK